jgi:hypothetical protein
VEVKALTALIVTLSLLQVKVYAPTIIVVIPLLPPPSSGLASVGSGKMLGSTASAAGAAARALRARLTTSAIPSRLMRSI